MSRAAAKGWRVASKEADTRYLTLLYHRVSHFSISYLLAVCELPRPSAPANWLRLEVNLQGTCRDGQILLRIMGCKETSHPWWRYSRFQPSSHIQNNSEDNNNRVVPICLRRSDSWRAIRNYCLMWAQCCCNWDTSTFTKAALLRGARIFAYDLGHPQRGPSAFGRVAKFGPWCLSPISGFLVA